MDVEIAPAAVLGDDWGMQSSKKNPPLKQKQ
jgi:hypothetical protein